MTLTSDALARFRDAERRLNAGEIPRHEFDAVAGSVVAVLAGAAEREAKLREVLWWIRGTLSEWRRLDIICPALAEDMRSKIDAALEPKGGE